MPSRPTASLQGAARSEGDGDLPERTARLRPASAWRGTRRYLSRWRSPRRRRSTRSETSSPRARASSPARRSSGPQPRSRLGRWWTTPAAPAGREHRGRPEMVDELDAEEFAVNPLGPRRGAGPQGPTSDPVRMYLKEIGKVPLLTAGASHPGQGDRRGRGRHRRDRQGRRQRCARPPRPGCGSCSAPSATASWRRS